MQPGRFGAEIPLLAEKICAAGADRAASGFRPAWLSARAMAAGFYDRTLAQLRARGEVLAIGLAYGAQAQPAVPIEPTG